MLFGECKAFMVVEDLVVEQDARRSGVGTKLMIELEKYAKENNCSYIMLITDQERKQAHQFYESLEYQSEPFRAFKKKL
jgi:GNAT superfamily N-acetyltransferase